MKEDGLWIFSWLSGGYNWVRANSKEEALKQIKLEFTYCLSTLQVDENSLREGTWDELDRIDCRYAGMFD